MSSRLEPSSPFTGRGPLGVTCGYCRYCLTDNPTKKSRTQSICTHPEAPPDKNRIYRSWTTCQHYDGPSGTVQVTCPNPKCGKVREIYRVSYDSPRHTAFCRGCAANMTKDVARDVAKDVAGETLEGRGKGRVPGENRPVMTLPEFDGCHPVRAPERTPRTRCFGGGDGRGCSNYDACLEYSAKKMWPGFTSSI